LAIKFGRKIDEMAIQKCQHLPLKDLPKFTQNGDFKIYHLATLIKIPTRRKLELETLNFFPLQIHVFVTRQTRKIFAQNFALPRSSSRLRLAFNADTKEKSLKI
jgi:hypothetical protein